MPALITARLTLTPLSIDDAPFMLGLLNEPTWLRYIGDRGVRTLEQAREYITKGAAQKLAQRGLGSFLVRISSDRTPIGTCGLYQRDYLPDSDVGFAFLPRYTGHGYAWEAASAVMAHGRAEHGLTRFLAITSPDNAASIKLLTKLGLRFDQLIRVPGETTEVRLFTTDPALAQ